MFIFDHMRAIADNAIFLYNEKIQKILIKLTIHVLI